MALELENNSLKEDKFNQEARPESLGSISGGGETERPQESSDVTEIPRDVLGVDVETVSPKPTGIDKLSPAQEEILAKRKEKISAVIKRKRQQQYPDTVKMVEFIEGVEAASSGGAKSAAFYASVSDQVRGLEKSN